MTKQSESVKAEEFQPRYVAYAKAAGLSPEAALAKDRDSFPGGVMTGFILWIGSKWSEWRKLNGVAINAPLFPKDHADFDTWLLTSI